MSAFKFCSPKQQRFVLSDARRSLYSGAFGAGKTRGLWLRIMRIVAKHPRSRGAIFRKVAASLRHSTMATFEEYVPRHLYRLSKVERTIYWKNGARTLYMGLDDPDKIGSLELDYAALDEAAEFDLPDYMQLRGRVGRGPATKRDTGSMPYGQIFMATNPGPPTHWLYGMYFREHEGEIIETETADNTLLPDEYVGDLDKFQGLFRERYVRGRWVSMEGMVYDMFNPAQHVVAPFRIPLAWPRFAGVDFGFTNPFVVLYAALDPDDTLFVYRQHYMSQKTVRTHARQYLSRLPWPDSAQADHDAEDRATLAEEGFPTAPADKEVSPGIQDVQQRLAMLDAHGRPKLRIFRNSLLERDVRMFALKKPTCLEDELQAYMWDPKEGKDTPVKRDDHACDALRYLVRGIRRGVAPVVGVTRVLTDQPETMSGTTLDLVRMLPSNRVEREPPVAG